ncbi:type II toxin-antitoxin system VapC family toxin [Dankookia sp. GCM10030260]|uniref:type II toxin-antitoxin system VapC family toxin n=1 Tax=Dankookia sp. GCM10030260 TaxID=3273390 RepID=UPI00361D230E
MIYLDASAFVSLFVEDAHSGRIRGLMRARRPAVAVSTFGLVEFAATVATRDRAGRLAAGQAATILLQADAWVAAQATTLEVDAADHRTAAAYVRRFELGLRAPDALHLATCARLGLPLLSVDQRQAAAAAALGLALVPAEA